MRLNFLILFIVLLSVLTTPTTLANTPCTLQGQESQSLDACQRILNEQTLPDFLLKTINNTMNWQAVEIAVNNSNAIAAQRLLSLGIPDAFFMQVIQLQNQQTQLLLSLDKNSSFNKRPVQNRFLYTWLDLPAKQTTVLYIIYATHGKTPLEPRLLTLNQLSKQDTKNNLINGVIFWVLLILIPILLFSQQDGLPYATSRSYVLLILSELLFISQTEGYNFQFLWADYPLWNRQVPGVIGVILVLAHALFTISFFQVRQRFKGFFYAFVVVILLTIMGLLLRNTEYFTQWTATMVIIYAFLSLILGLLASVQQLPAAKFYLLGSLSLIIFNVILLLSSLFWRNPFPDISLFTYPKLAYAFESVFFIIAVLNQLRLFNAQKAQLRIKRQAETEQLIKPSKNV
ncbi:MAG: 7TM-DISM domain-containing protein [Methylococcaceae bacterium]